MHVYFNSKFDKKTVSIGPGESFATGDNVIIQTVLGSCVAACFYTDNSNFIGMNHFMLPGHVNRKEIASSEEGRYGMYAMEKLMGEFVKQGIEKSRIKAKIFGGANMIQSSSKMSSISINNINFIKEFLEREKIPVVSSHLGGTEARKILFFSDTKKVLLKKIPKSITRETFEEEIAYEEKLEKAFHKKKPSTIIFFDQD